MKELMMRVFVAGATGAIGKQLVPRLVEAGHEVHGMTRSESKQAMLYELGAVPVVADALDPDQVAEGVGRAGAAARVRRCSTSGALCRWSRTRLIPIRSRRPWAGRGRT